jgi:hypothetical protein
VVGPLAMALRSELGRSSSNGSDTAPTKYHRRFNVAADGHSLDRRPLLIEACLQELLLL